MKGLTYSMVYVGALFEFGGLHYLLALNFVYIGYLSEGIDVLHRIACVTAESTKSVERLIKYINKFFNLMFQRNRNRKNIRLASLSTHYLATQ